MSTAARKSTLVKFAPSLIRGAIGAYIFKAIGAVSGFVVAVMVARYLGASGAGIYYTAIPIVMMGSYFSRMGLDQLGMRESAAASVSGVSLRGLWYNLLSIVFVCAILLATLVALSGILFSSLYDQPELIWLLPVFAPAVVFIALFNLGGQVVRGLEMIWYSSFVLFAGHNLLQAVLIGLLFLGVFSFVKVTPLLAVTMAYVVGAGVIALMALLWASRFTHDKDDIESASKKIDRRALLVSGQPLLYYGLGAMAFQWTDTLVLAAFSDSQDVAVYNSALRVAQGVGFFLLAVAAASGPRFVTLYRSDQKHELLRSYRHATKLTIIAALPIVVLLWVGGRYIMALFGPEFVSGTLPLAILAAGQLVNALTGPVTQVLIASNQERLLRNLTIIMALINIPLNLTLAPLWGSIGTAIATALSISLVNIGAIYFAAKRLGLPLLGCYRSFYKPGT